MKKNNIEIKIAQLQFPELKIRPSELHKVRGYFGEQFREFDLLHNHDLKTGKNIYRYPAIQFKIADKSLSIFSYGEKAIEIFKTIFFKSDEIKIGLKTMEINEKQLEIKEESFGLKDDSFVYSFISPWIGLNQKNYSDYIKLNSEEEKKDKLNSILINNIISFCKFAGYTVMDKIKVKSKLRRIRVNLKGLAHIGFKGTFMVNFLLPDYLGLGKSSSRGYGCIKREM